MTLTDSFLNSPKKTKHQELMLVNTLVSLLKSMVKKLSENTHLFPLLPKEEHLIQLLKFIEKMNTPNSLTEVLCLNGWKPLMSETPQISKDLLEDQFTKDKEPYKSLNSVKSPNTTTPKECSSQEEEQELLLYTKLFKILLPILMILLKLIYFMETNLLMIYLLDKNWKDNKKLET